jgi:hypothetical protein
MLLSEPYISATKNKNDATIWILLFFTDAFRISKLFWSEEARNNFFTERNPKYGLIARAWIHTHTLTLAHIHSYTHTHSHTHSYTLTHTLIHTHSYTHTLNLLLTKMKVQLKTQQHNSILACYIQNLLYDVNKCMFYEPTTSIKIKDPI